MVSRTGIGAGIGIPFKNNALKGDKPYLPPEIKDSLKAVVIAYGKTNNDSDRAIVKNLVDPDNPFVISNAAYTEGSGYADKDSPYYGAFVTDGIDDLITSTKTVQEMGITDEVTVVSMIHQIDLNSTYTIATTNYIENSNSKEHVRSDVYNYGKTGIYGYSASLINNTKSDIKNILGDEADYYVKSTNSLQTIFDAKFSVVGRISELTEASQVAWYWTIIANKVLTTDQINQVIAYYNLDRCVEPTVLYDVKRQGLSNDTPDSDWYLKDFSKNGFDMSLFNFAKNLDSGIGKYGMDFLEWKSNSGMNFTSTKLTSTKPNLSGGWLTFRNVSGLIPETKVKVSGAPREFVFIGNNNGTDDKFSVTINNGVYTIPEFTLSSASGFYINNNSGDWSNLVIEQIPSHAGALCFDGVNDFGETNTLPIFRDYTVIADREIIDALPENADGGVALKGRTFKEGAFAFDCKDQVSSFGVSSNKLIDVKRFVSYQSKYTNNGNSISYGNVPDTSRLFIGRMGLTTRYSKFALWSLLLFPYSLSEFLIERQLKKRKAGTLYPDMVEFRPIVKSNLSYSSITYSVNPGEYISVDSMVTITVTLPNTSDKLMEVSCNAISDISISGDNGVYEITGKIVKSPQKINLVISSYLTMLNNETLISNETLIKNE